MHRSVNGTGASFITTSDLVFQSEFFTSSYSITAIYITVVLTVGSFLRSCLSSPLSKIMYEEFQYADDLMSLCDGIFIARRTGDLLKEEDLYRKLIRIYRSPSTLIALTRRKKKD